MKRYISMPFLNLFDNVIAYDMALLNNTEIKGNFGKVRVNKKLLKHNSKVKFKKK